MPHIGLTTQQKKLVKLKLGDDDLATTIIDMVDTGVNANGINNTTQTYVANTEGLLQGLSIPVNIQTILSQLKENKCY